MAATSSKAKSPLSFSISYGIFGGPGHSRRLRKKMMDAGYQYTDLVGADILIAHSAGVWLIPQGCRPKLVVYVGMPLAQEQPHKTFVKTNLRSIRRAKPIANFKKGLSVYYGLVQPRRNISIIRGARQAQPVIFQNIPSIFITNHDDLWPKSENLQQLIDTHDWTFISLPGAHGNIWEEPEDYVAIINRYARLLV